MLGRISNIESSIPGMTITSSDDVSISSADDFNVKNDTSTTTDSQSYQKYQNKQIKLTDKSLIFGSIKGKYFYYKGCGGANISTKNLVYYKSEADAIGRGKVIYAKCK